MRRRWDEDDLPDGGHPHGGGKNPYRESLASPPADDGNALTEADLASVGRRTPAHWAFRVPDALCLVGVIAMTVLFFSTYRPRQSTGQWWVELWVLISLMAVPIVTTGAQYIYVRRIRRLGLTAVIPVSRTSVIA